MPNDVNANEYSLTVLDYSREKSTSQLNIKTFVDNAALLTAQAAFEAAVTAVINGELAQRAYRLITRLTNVPPADQEARREDKFLVRFQGDTTLNVYTFSIPCADLSTVTMVNNTDFVDITTGAGQTLKDAIEDFVDSPSGIVEDITVLSIEAVGRNL